MKMPNNAKHSDSENGTARTPAHGLSALPDDELEQVAGGQDIVFKGDEFHRDSWFVTFLTKQMIQFSIRQELSRPLDATPQEITIEGRKYRVWQVGETAYVEAAD